jgi:hypothetical protein
VNGFANVDGICGHLNRQGHHAHHVASLAADHAGGQYIAVAVRQSKRKVLDKSTPMHAINDKLKKTNAGVRAKVENRFRWSSVNLGMKKYASVGLRKIRRDCIPFCRGPTYGWRVISICRSYRVEFAYWRSETALGFPTAKILSSPAFSLLVWKARTKDPHRHALQRHGHRAQKKWWHEPRRPGPFLDPITPVYLAHGWPTSINRWLAPNHKNCHRCKDRKRKTRKCY